MHYIYDYRKVHLRTQDGHLCHTIGSTQQVRSTAQLDSVTCGHCLNVIKRVVLWYSLIKGWL